MSYRADKLVIDARTDTHTDRQTQATTIPEGQYWPRVKTALSVGDFALVLTCQKGRFSDIHRRRFVMFVDVLDAGPIQVKL